MGDPPTRKNKKSSKKKAKDPENSALRVRVALCAVRWGGVAIGTVSLPTGRTTSIRKTPYV